MISNIFNNKDCQFMLKVKILENGYMFNDHCEALLKLYLKGKSGESYNVGSRYKYEKY